MAESPPQSWIEITHSHGGYTLRVLCAKERRHCHRRGRLRTVTHAARDDRSGVRRNRGIRLPGGGEVGPLSTYQPKHPTASALN
jgi:hypothetical protein